MAKPINTWSFKDETGNKYGRLTVLSLGGRTDYGFRWKCICECGNELYVLGSYLRRGTSKSCGCLRQELQSANMKRRTADNDMRTYHPLFVTYLGMLARCYNKDASGYKNYGGRGILVCDEWKGNFWQFVADMGEKPKGDYTLDRKDNDGNYEKNNCKWSTKIEQEANKRNKKCRL